jgi:hypothetical protein
VIRHRLSWPELERLTSNEPKSEVDLLLSFDFDFFTQRPNPNACPDPARAGVARDVPIEEWFSNEDAKILWKQGYEAMKEAGLPPETLIAPLQEPMVSGARQALAKRFDIAEAAISDSHVWGAYMAMRTARACDRPIEIVNFDFHHDCGYIAYGDDTQELSRRRAYDAASYEDWLQTMLVRGVCSYATIVFPDWGGDWAAEPPTLPLEYQGRVRRLLFSQWLDEVPSSTRAANLLLVRSPTWLPPWGGADEAFLAFANALAPNRRCLDCDPPGGLKIGAGNACAVRPHPDSYRVSVEPLEE